MTQSETPTTTTLLNPSAVRSANAPFQVDLGNGTHVMAKRLDMQTMVFEGLVPLPMLSAMQSMLTAAGDSPAEKFAAVDAKVLADVKEMLRRHACVAVVSPVLVAEDDGVESHIPVSLLPMDHLMMIWNATAVLPSVATATAQTFRDEPQPVVPDDVRTRENVPHPTEPVGVAEFIAR